MKPAFRILANDLIRRATFLTATPLLADGMGADNLRTLPRAEVARTTGTGQVLSGNFAAASSCSMCVLWRHNLSSAATWRLELFSSAGLGGTKVYDSGDQVALMAAPLEAPSLTGGAVLGEFQQPAQHSVLYFEPVVARSFKLTLSDSTNGAGYLQASRLMMGAFWEPGRGSADYGAELQWIDDSTQQRSASGSLRTPNPRGSYRQLTMDCSEMDLADAGALARIVGQVGKRAEIWISLYPGWGALDGAYLDAEYLHGMVGKIVGPHGAARRGWNHWVDRLQVQEV